MRPISSVAFGLVLVSGTVAAQAQTTVTRQVTSEPVETVVTQGPAGTSVTRRILSTDPGVTYAAPPVEYLPAPQVVTETYVAPSPAVTTRRLTTKRRISKGRVTARTTVTRPPAARTVARAAVATDRALILTPAQRQIVYRDIVAREGVPARVVVPATPPVVAADEEIDTPAGYPLRTIYPADDDAYRDRWHYDDWRWDGRPVVQPAPVVTAPVAYSVGTRLSQSVPLVAVPDVAAVRVPVAAPYSYAMINGRVYLVDPASSIIVADVSP